MDTENIFDEIQSFPDPDAAARFAELVGLDAEKDRLIKEARLLLNPSLLDEWSNKQHGTAVALVDHFRNRAPFFIFGGDVGTGKTSLAETFGDSVARQEGLGVTLYHLSLNARGAGAVGEMTRLLTAAFQKIRETAAKGASGKGRPSSAVILLVDEADAIAQSREFAQMHHEDRAGVNALIRGIDSLAAEHLPAIVVMCTNRLGAIDPAVKRRAAAIFEFHRPNEPQRVYVLERGLEGVGFSDAQVSELARATGANGRPYGFTYSDLVRRFLPALLLDAFPDRPITFDRALEIVRTIDPTPPFSAEESTRVSKPYGQEERKP